MKKEKIDRPVCTRCNIRLVRKNKISCLGFQLWKKYCRTCEKIIYNLPYKKGGDRKLGYMASKGNKCEICGFIPKHPCQLDVDHIDGDVKNNDPNNLQTICANCHRLKTNSDLKKQK